MRLPRLIALMMTVILVELLDADCYDSCCRKQEVEVLLIPVWMRPILSSVVFVRVEQQGALMVGLYHGIHERYFHPLGDIIGHQPILTPRSTPSDNGPLTSTLVTTKDKMCNMHDRTRNLKSFKGMFSLRLDNES